MKTLLIFMTMAGLVAFPIQLALANDASGAVHLQVPIKQQANPIAAATAIKPASSRTTPLVASKPVLPINSGQRHSPAIIGGMAATTAHKSAVINGTEMKRHP